MKKVVKILNLVFTIIVIIGVSTQVMASTSSTLGNGLNSNVLNDVTKQDNTLFNKLNSPINKILGVAGIMVNGVRYMYASSNDKAKIKQSLIFVVIGTIFIFATDVVVRIVVGSWGDISNGLS